MVLDKSLLPDLEELASLPGITKRDITLYFGLEEESFDQILLNDSAAKNSYDKGRLVAKVEFTKKIKQLSQQGSGPAQTLLLKLMNNEEFQELRSFYK
jgi:hypothetical protein